MRAVSVAIILVLAAGLAAAAAAPLIRGFKLPTTHAGVGDVAVAPGGMVYFTESAANKIGRLDPRSGRIEEFEVPTAGSRPEGIVAGRDYWVTFAESRAGKIGRFQEYTREFREFPVGSGVDPNMPILLGKDIYFTARRANLIGRLDPASGEVTTFAIPTAWAMPSAIKRGPLGALYFCEFGAGRIGRFDPQNGHFQDYLTLTADSGPRRLSFAGNRIYFTEYKAGRIGRFDIASGNFTEWACPGGPHSHPYGIVADQAGMVWYEETATGTIVRMDPRSGRFISLRLPWPGAIVRDIAPSPDGDLWMALSGADRIGVIKTH